MNKQFKQNFSIKQVPTDEAQRLEETLNSMSEEGWELYSIYETEQNSKIVYNCIFVKEVENIDTDSDDELINFRSTVEKMIFANERPYELCLNLQKKIRDKKEKIERVKKFLENAKEDEREFLNDEIKRDIDELNILKKDLKEVLSPSKMSKFLGEDKLSISLSNENYCLCDPQRENNLLLETVKVRQNLTDELGYIIPKIQFIENNSLAEAEFSINIHGTSVVCAKAYPNHKAFFEDELNIEKAPKNSFKTKDPLSGKKLIWIEERECKDFWVEGLSASEYIMGYLSHYAIVYVDEIFDYNDLNRYIDFVSEQNSYLTDNIIGGYLNVSELKLIFIQLLRERISVKDVVYIFEKLNDFSEDLTKSNLLEKLRIALSRQISRSISNKDKEISAYEVNEETLQLIENQIDEKEHNVKIDLSKFSKFKKALKKAYPDMLSQGAVLIVPLEYRQIIFIIASQLLSDIQVVCYEEIALEYKLNIIGKI